MILDSSAVVAVALREPDHERILAGLAHAPRLGIGAPTLVETTIVLSARLMRDARGLVSRFLIEGDVAASRSRTRTSVRPSRRGCGTAAGAIPLA